MIRSGNPELDSISSHSNECPEEINETYNKFHEENGTIPLPWFNDFHTKPSKGWYILPTGFTAPELCLFNTGCKAVPRSNFNALNWNICTTNTENKGLWIGQEVKAQFTELSVEITSELWWPLRGRGSEGSTHCLLSTAFTLMKPWARWKPTILKGQVYTVLRCTSFIKNSSEEAPFLLLCHIWSPCDLGTSFSDYALLSKARNFAILSPINVTNHYQMF